MGEKLPQFYLVCGLCCSGKSTFAKPFSERNHLIYVNVDDVYRLFNGDDRIRDNYLEIWQTVFSIINCAQRNKKDILVDTCSLLFTERQQFLFLFPYFEHHLIYISTDFVTMKKNMQKRERKIPNEILEKMKNELEIPSRDEKGWKSIQYYYNDGEKFTEICE